MKAIIYISQALVDFDNETLAELASKAQQHNYEKSITGYLWYKKGQFLQYIEGDDFELDDLMARINSDKRHKLIYTVHEGNIRNARFPGWSMRYFSEQYALEIGLETILTDQLLLIQKVSQQLGNDYQMIWRIVEKLADQKVAGG